VDQMMQALKEDRASLLRTDAFRSLAFILLAAGLIWLFINDKVKKNIFLGGMVVLMFLDLYPVGKRYLTDDDFIDKSKYNQNFEPTPADELISKETSKDYRVLNLATDPWNDSRTSYFHESVGGYHAAKLRRFQEIIEHQLTRNDSLKGSPYPFNKSVIDMLNTKYIIVPGQNQQEQVVPNTQALGNAWFVDSVKVVNNADAEMSALYHFNPSSTAIVDKRFASQLQGYQSSHDSTAHTTLDSYSPNDLKYSSKSSKDNVIVFSEIYYQPGWNAYVDGKKSDHFRCNYILRGMRVPAGEHQIEFKFEPQSFYAGEKVAYGSSGLLLLIAIGGLIKERKKLLSQALK
ncbi:MAG: YfhO family protein, partial [Chitinophagales bacterium]